MRTGGGSRARHTEAGERQQDDRPPAAASRARQIGVFLAAIASLLVIGATVVHYISDSSDPNTVSQQAGGQQPVAPALPPPASGAPIIDPSTIAALERVGETQPSGPDTDPLTFYVSPEVGDDADDGQTPQAPWRSLQASLDQLEPGQTLYLMDGSYTDLTEPGNAHYTMDVDGTADAWIRITAAPGHQPELVPSNGNGLSVRGNYVEVSGLRVRGEGFDEGNSYGWGLLVRGSHHVRLTGNTISDMAVGGISAVESSNLEIYDNVVFDNSFWGTEQGSGISIWHSRDHGTEPDESGYHDRIIGNVTYRNENKVFSRWAPGQNLITDGNGIIIDETIELGYSGRILVANNVAFDNGGRGIIVNKATKVDVVFNTTYRNARTEGLGGGPVEIGVRRSTDVQVLNNLAWSRPGSPGIKVAENEQLVMGGNVFISDSPSGGETDLDLVTTADPGLQAPSIDPAAADFTPRPGSIVVDSAVDAGPRIQFDASGQPRSPATADVGAYELQ